MIVMSKLTRFWWTNSISKYEQPVPNAAPFDGAGLVKAVREGELSAREVCNDFIKCIQSAENKVHAFAHFNEQVVMRQADAVDARVNKGRLAGLPIGVKDIFDTADFPTEYNSRIYRGHQPSRDSSVVARLRAEDAVVIGKTETTEFAFMRTGPTRNPHGMDRTPGSSSAGSAAGMASGFFPVALGTQTAGSLIKPASYCGAFAFKPSFGLVSLEGTKPLAPSLDTVGWFGRSVGDLQLIAEVLLGSDLNLSLSLKPPLHLVAARTDFWNDAEQAVKDTLDAAIEALKERGHRVEDSSVPFDYRRLAAAHKVINDKEGVRSLAYEFACHRSLLSDSILQMEECALELSYSEEAKARAYILSEAAKMSHFMERHDAIITPSTAYEAPVGLEATGTSDFIKTWNALGMPQINVPVAHGRNRMPIGVQIIGARGHDWRLLEVARIVSGDLGVLNSALAHLSG
jgi:Asp-tRNA(Asn)/Glu-tRNA(Gln) amidotransferase A subunit family amidase